jgi:hypothetical protein
MERWISLKEAAEHEGVTQGAIRGRAKIGTIKSRLVDGVNSIGKRARLLEVQLNSHEDQEHKRKTREVRRAFDRAASEAPTMTLGYDDLVRLAQIGLRHLMESA